jgi:UDP-N-acetylmuramate--alanine ligase
MCAGSICSPVPARFDVMVTDRKSGAETRFKDFLLPMIGEHNVQNSLAAIAIGWEMQIPEAKMRAALAGFEGVKRRFTRTGETDGITVIDDYGHHPVEITAVLKAARAATRGRVIAVVQPHRFTRLRDLFEDFCTCFNDADAVIVAPVHPAGEQPIEGFDSAALAAGLRHHGHRAVQTLAGPDDLPGLVDGLAESGDLVVCLGAGSISAWANSLPEDLRRLRAEKKEAANDAG